MHNTTLALFAAANDQDSDSTHDMYDAIVRGLRNGPVGVMDELELIGITPDMSWRHEEATEEAAGLKEKLGETYDRIRDLESTESEQDETITALYEELDELRKRLGDAA